MSDNPWSLETTLLDILHITQYTWQDMQKLLLQATLHKHAGNKTYAAKALGISIRTLRNKCRKYNL